MQTVSSRERRIALEAPSAYVSMKGIDPIRKDFSRGHGSELSADPISRNSEIRESIPYREVRVRKVGGAAVSGTLVTSC